MRTATLSLLAVPALAWAGRPDYSHLSDAELERVLWQIGAGVLGMALLGAYGLWRYRRRYEPGPGRFSPLQVLLSVGAVLLMLGGLVVSLH